MRIQLTGEEAAHVVGPQLGNIDSAPCELLSQQPTRDTNPVSACPCRQSPYIAQVLVVAAQFLGNVIAGCYGRRCAWRARCEVVWFITVS